MRTVLLTAALLALAACGRDPAPPEEPTAPVQPLPEPSKPPLVQPPEAPVSMAFVDASGTERLRLACRAGDASLQISVPGFEPIASEERLTLGAGDEAFTHVADLQASGPGVTGGGAIDPALIDRLARGEPVRAVYGARSVGPLQAAQPQSLAAFTGRCRGLIAR